MWQGPMHFSYICSFSQGISKELQQKWSSEDVKCYPHGMLVLQAMEALLLYHNASPKKIHFLKELCHVGGAKLQFH